jgi:hypothetical protein
MAGLEEALVLEGAGRVVALTEVGEEAADSHADSESLASLKSAMVAAIEEGSGSGQERLALGRVLGWLGDPRLSAPREEAYWVPILDPYQEARIARYLVTNQEYRVWVAAGGYKDRSVWSEEGWSWLQGTEDPWPKLADLPSSAPFVVPNGPVVGVTWFEADAYARSYGARLPFTHERVWVMRGEERRPYPWGAPFGEGNSNTREEALKQPCAVGLYVRDRTPEGVCDLAGNVAEWSGDAAVVGVERLVHPGSWEQPSLAAWAKALTFERPVVRRTSLGMRLAKDLD